MIDAVSPDGRFEITVRAWEARMSHWIETPLLTETTTGKQILFFEDPHWSLDEAKWLDAGRVELVMRKYPGNHKPVDVRAIVNCVERTANIDAKQVTLFELERALDSAIEFY